MKIATLLADFHRRGVPGLLRLGGGFLATPLYTNAFFLWANTGLNALGGVAFWGVAARLYRPQDVGLGAAALSALALIAMLSQLGLGSGLIRFLPGEGGKASGLINGGFTLCSLAALLATAVFLAGLPWWSPELLFLRQPTYLGFFALFSLAAALHSLLDMVFVAQRAAKFVLLRAGVFNLLRLFLPALLAVFLPSFGIVAAYGLGLIGSLIYGGYALLRLRADWRPRLHLNMGPLVKVTPFALGNYLCDLLMAAPSLLLTIMVVNLLGPEQGAYFYIAWALGNMLFSAILGLSLSLFAEGSHQPGRLLPLLRRSLMGALALTGAGAALLFLAGDKFLLLFGREYSQQGIGVLRLVGLASIPASVTYLYLGIKRVQKEVGPLLVVSAVVAVVTLAVSYRLLPRLGLEGVGIGFLAGQALGAIMATAQSFHQQKGALGALLGSRKEISEN